MRICEDEPRPGYGGARPVPTNVDSINVCQRVLTRQSLVLTHRGAQPQQ